MRNSQARLLERLERDVRAAFETTPGVAPANPAWMTVDCTVASNVGFLHFGRESGAAAIVELSFDFQGGRARFGIKSRGRSFPSLDNKGQPTGRLSDALPIDYSSLPEAQEAAYDALLGLIVEALG